MASLPTLDRLFERRDDDVALLARTHVEHFDVRDGYISLDAADRLTVEALSGDACRLVRAGILAAAIWLDGMGIDTTNAALVGQAVAEAIAASRANLDALQRVELGWGPERPLPVMLLGTGVTRARNRGGRAEAPRFVAGGVLGV